MNLLKELEPYHKNLDAFKAGYGITDTVVIQKLADIWDAFADTRKKAIYGSDNAVIPRTKTTCASCIKDMMNMLCNWREIVQREEGEKLVEFKSVKAKVEVVKPKTDWDGIVKSIETTVEAVNSLRPDSFYSNLKMHELRRLAKDHKVSYTPKTKVPELIELIKAKVSEPK